MIGENNMNCNIFLTVGKGRRWNMAERVKVAFIFLQKSCALLKNCDNKRLDDKKPAFIKRK